MNDNSMLLEGTYQKRWGVPKKPMFFDKNKQKQCKVPKKPKEPMFLTSSKTQMTMISYFWWPEHFKNIGSFSFFGTLQHFWKALIKSIGFFGTLQQIWLGIFKSVLLSTIFDISCLKVLYCYQFLQVVLQTCDTVSHS